MIRLALPGTVLLLIVPLAGCSTGMAEYPVHRDIVATTFWVGELFDARAADGSQVYSAYDSAWRQHYGGCDGVVTNGNCETERRSSENGYFPRRMVPKENPFYLDLPFDDIGDPQAFAMRARVVPWAGEFAGSEGDRTVSFMKNRWVRISRGQRVCYGQVEDAGPGVYHDAAYVFGTAAPLNKRFNGAGMDVSPALNGCLGFTSLNGQSDQVDWQFVSRAEVPDGPWSRIITESPVFQGP
ncbi:hypothetical protein [Sciscionella sediminilitoris]|uniref:hypothetical protein n=1 Tax=Sciscionella sediminilitoris TaxID=1445613 RepID=UPI00068A6299|nr:hypothetical protein [Sciscionella sp. SE31]